MGWPGQSSEHDADHGETDEGCGGSHVALEIARKAAVVADPREGSLDDPAFGENDEAMQLVALHDLELPGAGPGDSSRSLRSLVASIGEDALDKGKETTGATVENGGRAIAILHVGRVSTSPGWRSWRTAPSRHRCARMVVVGLPRIVPKRSCRAFLSEVLASLSVSPSFVITAFVHVRASAAHRG